MIGALAAALLLAAPTVAFTVPDPRIDEASGIAPGIRSPGVVYVQNDSGDRARFFAVNARTGATAAVVRVPGATNVDWEDLAVAPDAAGTPSVWISDTGDNTAARDEVRVYRVDEPRVAANARDASITSARPDVWRLRYPDGPADVESLAVAPGGTAYLVTKSFTGASVVYRVPARPDPARVQTTARVASLGFGATGTSGGPAGVIGQVTATGAAFSRDGTTFVVRTYTDAYFWRVRDGDLAGALKTAPVRVALPQQQQGEGIAFSGSSVLIDSEGVGQPVYRVAVPRLSAVSTPSPSSDPPSDPTAAANSLASGPSSLTFGASEPDDGDRSGSDTTRYALGGAVVIVLGLIVVLVSRRRR